MPDWVSLLCNAERSLQTIQESQAAEPTANTHRMSSLANQLSDRSQKLDGEKIIINILALVFHMTYVLSVCVLPKK